MSTLHSDSPLAAAMPQPDRVIRGSRTATIACALGNALEMYDFTIYSFFAVIIAEQFFPAQSPVASLLMSLTAFGAGLLASGGVSLVCLKLFPENTGRT